MRISCVFGIILALLHNTGLEETSLLLLAMVGLLLAIVRSIRWILFGGIGVAESLLLAATIAIFKFLVEAGVRLSNVLWPVFGCVEIGVRIGG
jgi:hypothetical protein